MNRLMYAAVSLLAVPAVASADFISQYVPDWQGEAGASYYEWQSFTDAGGANMPTNEPFPSGDAMLLNVGSGAMISGEGNMYGFGGPLDIHVYGYADADVQNVAINMSVLGTEMLYDHVTLVWLAADGSEGFMGSWQSSFSENYWEAADFGGFPGAIANVSYEWDLSGLAETVVAVGVFFQTAGPHSSLDAVSLDINVVPAPAALALFGLAAAGGRRRR